ncbi:MAG: 2,3-bisphosphoglycerate-independent phosphoglycerate mutase [Solirubrobacteraceae bacterium]
MATPVALVILDGWGLAEPGPGNAVELADTPVFDKLWRTHDTTTLTACGEAVGLPAGQMGNSEVGHLNLGAGAVVRQDLARIDAAIQDGSFTANETLRAALDGAQRVHLIGLASDGGVHSARDHLEKLLNDAVGVPEVIVHAFTDGRDVSPTQAGSFLDTLADWCNDVGNARVGTVIGRYYAMDRDKRWDRIEKAVRLLRDGEAEHRAPTAAQAARRAYDREETDEFIEATLIGDGDNRIRPEDTVVCFNFRPDRMREITEKLDHAPERYVTMTEYVEGWPYPVMFPPRRPETTLAKVISEAGLRQLHVAETEKYPHVTYFFNGGEERAYEGETRELVPSPRDVSTYDEKPEMSAYEATAAFEEHWRDDEPAFAIFNFANPDMVGHTGVIEAAVKAVEAVDECLGRVLAAVEARGGTVVVTADHGNCDEMLEDDGSPDTAHSLNPVPFVVTRSGVRLDGPGILADVAPTILALMDLEKPKAMSGRSLLED